MASSSDIKRRREIRTLEAKRDKLIELAQSTKTKLAVVRTELKQRRSRNN